MTRDETLVLLAELENVLFFQEQVTIALILKLQDDRLEDAWRTCWNPWTLRFLLLALEHPALATVTESCAACPVCHGTHMLCSLCPDVIRSIVPALRIADLLRFLESDPKRPDSARP